MTDDADTIAAIATAVGVGGVGIVRISGTRAVTIAEQIVGLALEDRRLHAGWARDSAARRIDQVLAFAMRAPRSFTGEDVAELHGHGGTLNLQALLSAVVERGARLAEPGEFTRRAVIHGKLDVVRAEALLDVVHAGNERALRVAQANLGGQLGGTAHALAHRTHRVLAEIEGRIDFPDDDLDAEDAARVDAELTALAAECGRLAAGFRYGRAVTAGLTVALVGRVNVGKSSLLNALVGHERALVAAAPGTTRDYLEVRDVWNGIPVTLVDTAGTRATDDPVERRGIELGEQRVAAADIVVVVNDDEGEWDDGVRFGARGVVVHGKSDLVMGRRRGLPASAVTGEGLEGLRRAVLVAAGVTERDGDEDAVISTTRQYVAARAALDACEAARRARAEGRPGEIVALELRAAADALASLRGVAVGEQVLDELFARFCIGK